MAALGPGFSGGDRIFVELAKRWQKRFPIKIYVWEEGREMCLRQGFKNTKNLKIVVWKMGFWPKLGFAVNYIARIILSVGEAFKLAIDNRPSTVVYSASDFWMDSVPGFILKVRHPKITWIGTFYLAAPNPFVGFVEKGKMKPPSLKNIVYWLQQYPIYWMIRLFSDMVCVTSDPDRRRFPWQDKKKTILVVRGGVDLKVTNLWKKRFGKISKIYDGVFLGRFHPQKGVVELVDIWAKVVKVRPKAKLAMIGDGPMMPVVLEKIKKHKLEKKIKLFGTLLDGEEKYKILSQGRIFIHSAVYDSGGMSCAEGMAWGMPGVAFDLEALKTYYPKGVLKAKIGNLTSFANSVLKLLNDENLYMRAKKDAISLVKEYWDWDKRAQDILEEFSE